MDLISPHDKTRHSVALNVGLESLTTIAVLRGSVVWCHILIKRHTCIAVTAL
jgi:hypothetical protein